MLRPHLPGLLRNVAVNLLPQIVVERRLIQPRQFFFQFHAKNRVRHTHPSGVRNSEIGNEEPEALSYREPMEPTEQRGRAALPAPRKPFSKSGGFQFRCSHSATV